MTDQQIEKLKKELKKEILAELKDEIKVQQFDYSGYKKAVVADDIAKAKVILKTNKWYWHIPVLGFYIFNMMFGRDLANIDRGILRREFTTQTIHFFLPLIVIMTAGFFLPTIAVVTMKWLLKRAVNKIEVKNLE